MKKAVTTKNDLRKRRHARVRARIVGTKDRPRLSVFKSNRFMSVQLIDDASGKTIASAHGREFHGSSSDRAKAIGEAIAKRAGAAGVGAIVFDRGGYAYAAQIKALAEAAREAGLKF